MPSFNKYLSNIYYVPGTITPVNKTSKDTAPQVVCILALWTGLWCISQRGQYLLVAVGTLPADWVQPVKV